MTMISVHADEVNPIATRELSWSERFQCMVGPIYVEIAGHKVRLDHMHSTELLENETTEMPGLTERTVAIKLSPASIQILVDAINNANGLDVLYAGPFSEDWRFKCTWKADTDKPEISRARYCCDYDLPCFYQD